MWNSICDLKIHSSTLQASEKQYPKYLFTISLGGRNWRRNPGLEKEKTTDEMDRGTREWLKTEWKIEYILVDVIMNVEECDAISRKLTYLIIKSLIS